MLRKPIIDDNRLLNLCIAYVQVDRGEYQVIGFHYGHAPGLVSVQLGQGKGMAFQDGLSGYHPVSVCTVGKGESAGKMPLIPQ